MFRWKRLRFLWSLSRKERKRWCLKHYRERDYRDECPECKDTTRAERNRINREMAYYNLALRDRELADNLLETGGLPEMVEQEPQAGAYAQPMGDFVPDVPEAFEDFVNTDPQVLR